MAQLIKLSDYVSRYEQDLSHYTTQFIRLKRYQWNRLKLQWESGAFDDWVEEEEPIVEEPTFFEKLFQPFKKKVKEDDEKEVDEGEEERAQRGIEEEFEQFQTPYMRPQTVHQLKKQYYDQLYEFQMKWASSTLMSHSRVHSQYRHDSFLRELIQQLPDSYLVMYEPIIQVKKAPIEMNIILLTPVQCITMTLVEQENYAVFVGSGDRFWSRKHRQEESRMLSPMIELNRNAKIIQALFQEHGIEFPVEKVLLSRTGYIDYPGAPYDVSVVDRKSYAEWFDRLGQSISPVKSNQYRAANRLLLQAQTTASSQLFGPSEEEVEEEER